jgi:hypothetical protein
MYGHSPAKNHFFPIRPSNPGEQFAGPVKHGISPQPRELKNLINPEKSSRKGLMPGKNSGSGGASSVAH